MSASLQSRYKKIRTLTERLCQPLWVEDYGVQSMPDVSPPKWHLGHTTWFFEQFVLQATGEKGAREYDPSFRFLFNSYYNSVGQRVDRAQRGQLSRPSVEEIYRYRHEVDRWMLDLLASNPSRELLSRVELGLHHEQQHQELLLMDIKHIFGSNPLRPTYAQGPDEFPESAPTDSRWIEFQGGLTEIGHSGSGFAFDHETPRHRVFLEPFQIASQLVTNGEYLEFMEAGGYANPNLWLSDGWQTVQSQGWGAPLYWERDGGRWCQMTLRGLRPVEEREPLSHVSYYEALAFASWKNARLPTEQEWEYVANRVTSSPEHSTRGNFLDSDFLLPLPPGSDSADPTAASVSQLHGDLWEWTTSAFLPYPGYEAPRGAFAEYNGKFMVNQMVLRGGACITPRDHMRISYRNFYYPDRRWVFSGFRLAKSVGRL